MKWIQFYHFLSSKIKPNSEKRSSLFKLMKKFCIISKRKCVFSIDCFNVFFFACIKNIYKNQNLSDCKEIDSNWLKYGWRLVLWYSFNPRFNKSTHLPRRRSKPSFSKNASFVSVSA